MANKKNVKRAGIITGAFLVGAVAGFASTSNTNTTSLLEFDALGSGHEIRVEIADMNTNHAIRTLELKCGEKKTTESKCGEGKCGEGEKAQEKEKGKLKGKESKAKAKTKTKKKGEKVGESKCGEGKCGN